MRRWSLAVAGAALLAACSPQDRFPHVFDGNWDVGPSPSQRAEPPPPVIPPPAPEELPPPAPMPRR